MHKRSIGARVALALAALGMGAAPQAPAAHAAPTIEQALVPRESRYQRAPRENPGRAWMQEGSVLAAGNRHMSLAELVRHSTYRARKARTHRRRRAGWRGRGSR